VTDNCIPFLNVRLIKNNQDIDTTVYRKPTNNDIYLHWNSFTPKSWRIGTLKTLLLRAYKICSNSKYRQEELEHISKVFHEINGYPKRLIKDLIKKAEDGIFSEQIDQDKRATTSILNLPYKGIQGEKLIKSMLTTAKQISENIEIKTVYTGTKLETQFNVKDRTDFKHQHNIVYKANCPDQTCEAMYVGETARRIDSRIDEHAGKDNKSHIYKHSSDSGHPKFSSKDFKILATKPNLSCPKRKIAEALYIKRLKPNLNIQACSVPLKLF